MFNTLPKIWTPFAISLATAAGKLILDTGQLRPASRAENGAGVSERRREDPHLREGSTTLRVQWAEL